MEETTCPICHEDDASFDPKCCKQLYHKKCYVDWIDIGTTCPTCRRESLHIQGMREYTIFFVKRETNLTLLITFYVR